MKPGIAASFCLLLCTVWTALAQSTILYKTGFESAEGYDLQFTLAGQRGWTGEGTGGNGLLLGPPEMGQQAYIGRFAPLDTNQATSVWTPIRFTPPASSNIVKFSVALQFFQSTAGGDDEFRWAVYNVNGDRLFSIDFFTRTQAIYFELQDRQLVNTGATFSFADAAESGLYDLEVWMDFGRNSWSAFLNGFVLASAEKIAQQTTTALNLGDIDAVWAIDNIRLPGNNYMTFDNYTVTAEKLSSIPVLLESRGPNQSGNIEFLIYTQPGQKYSVDVTTDFLQWFSLAEFVATQGSSLFEDTTSPNYRYGFYRVRQLAQ